MKIPKTGPGTFRAVFVTAGVGIPALVVFVLSFLPWFELPRKASELASVLPDELNAWDTTMGSLTVLAALAAGILAVIPQASSRGLYVAPALAAAVLALLRLIVAPTATVPGYSESYSRTWWAVVVVLAAVFQAVLAVVGTSRHNRAQVG